MDENNDESKSQNEDDGSSGNEVEPKLKYERLVNDVHGILQKEIVSYVAYDSKIICVGTEWGIVHLLDHQGNTIRNQHLKAHTVAVNQISIDTRGDFIATCSDDGKAYAYGLYTGEHAIELSIGRCVKSIAIDPYYYKLGANRRIVTGDDRLMLHEKKLLASVKSTLLYEAVGKVQNIRWQDRFIAWACDVGVRVYDIISRTSLVLIKWNRSEDLMPEKFPCCLNWKNNTTLLIGWVDTVRVCKIERRNSVIKDLPEFVVHPTVTFTTEYFVCGICPLDTTQLVILGYVKEKDEDGKSQRPRTYILQAKETKYVEMYEDKLSLYGFENCGCNDYQLECLVDENRFIIASRKDIVVASVYDCDDRIEWLTEHKKFEEAMELATQNERYLQRNTKQLVGRKYLDHLMTQKVYSKAGELCSRILGDNKELWEYEVFKFARAGQLRAVSQYLPVTEEHKLDPQIYEMVLYEFLKTEPKNFLEIIKKWSPELYNVHAVLNAVLEQVVKDSNVREILVESLAVLYAHSKQYDKSLDFYLKLKHKDVFHLIHKYNLYLKVGNEIANLMDLDVDQAVALFLGDKNCIPSETIVQRLKHNPYYLYKYLDALEAKEYKTEGRKYHMQLVKLYATFSRDKLLPLLKRSDSYPIQEALVVCKERNLYPEMVYLLGRIGNTKEALRLLIQKIGDVEQAIVFCKEHEDAELWEELIDQSLSKPEFVTFMLRKTGAYVDPTLLIRKIPNDTPIPGLKNSLVKMMRDYSLQIAVREGCKNIVVSDCFDLHKQLMQMQQSGICVDDELVCNVCHQKMLTKDSTNMLVFYCKHIFHAECLPSIGTVEKCIICSTKS